MNQKLIMENWSRFINEELDLSKAQELIDGLELIHKEAIEEDFNDNGAEAIIRREYFNHECQLTRDTSSMMDAIEGHIEMFLNSFPHSLIKQVELKCFEDAVENDWF